MLILTVSPEDQYAVRAIKAGAAGFLTKESAPEKLIEAVRKVASGGRYVSPELAEALASLFAGEGRRGAARAALGPRVRSDEDARVGEDRARRSRLELALSVKTVSTHRTRILKKMDMHTNAELTHYAMKNRIVE